MGTSEAFKDYLAKEIKIQRQLKGWTQQDLAEVTDLSRNFIGEIERCEKNPGPETLLKIFSCIWGHT